MNFSVGTWGYVLLCVFLPTLWGLVIVAVTKFLERRLLSRRADTVTAPGENGSEDRRPAPDYYI